jgi:hypothetical protein
MQPVRFGPHRGADWLNRVAYSPGTSPFCERFTLIAQDPKHPRALLITLSLTHGKEGVTATTSALFDDGITGEHWLAEESWPMDRARIDPERGGLGLGECFVGDGSTQGLIHSGEFALSWALHAPYDGLPHNLLGSDGLYGGHKLSHKVALTVPSAPVLEGYIEIWRTPGRYSQRTRLDCQGWHINQSHVFGHGSAGPYVHVHVPPSSVDESSLSLDLFCLRTKVLGLVPTTLFLGDLQTPDGAKMARAWHYGGVLPTPTQASLPWQFTISHSGATWRGEVLANPKRVVKLHGMHGGAYALAFGATVRASVTTADSKMRAIISDQALVEVGGPGAPSS